MIVVNGNEFRTLDQPIYLGDGRQVFEAWANGVMVYPEIDADHDFAFLAGSNSFETALSPYVIYNDEGFAADPDYYPFIVGPSFNAKVTYKYTIAYNYHPHVIGDSSYNPSATDGHDYGPLLFPQHRDESENNDYLIANQYSSYQRTYQIPSDYLSPGSSEEKSLIALISVTAKLEYDIPGNYEFYSGNFMSNYAGSFELNSEKQEMLQQYLHEWGDGHTFSFSYVHPTWGIENIAEYQASGSSSEALGWSVGDNHWISSYPFLTSSPPQQVVTSFNNFAIRARSPRFSKSVLCKVDGGSVWNNIRYFYLGNSDATASSRRYWDVWTNIPLTGIYARNVHFPGESIDSTRATTEILFPSVNSL